MERILICHARCVGSRTVHVRAFFSMSAPSTKTCSMYTALCVAKDSSRQPTCMVTWLPTPTSSILDVKLVVLGMLTRRRCSSTFAQGPVGLSILTHKPAHHLGTHFHRVPQLAWTSPTRNSSGTFRPMAHPLGHAPTRVPVNQRVPSMQNSRTLKALSLPHKALLSSITICPV